MIKDVCVCEYRWVVWGRVKNSNASEYLLEYLFGYGSDLYASQLLRNIKNSGIPD